MSVRAARQQPVLTISWTVAALAVLGGRGLLRLIDMATVRKMTAAVLLILGLATAVSALA